MTSPLSISCAAKTVIAPRSPSAGKRPSKLVQRAIQKEKTAAKIEGIRTELKKAKEQEKKLENELLKLRKENEELRAASKASADMILFQESELNVLQDRCNHLASKPQEKSPTIYPSKEFKSLVEIQQLWNNMLRQRENLSLVVRETLLTASSAIAWALRQYECSNCLTQVISQKNHPTLLLEIKNLTLSKIAMLPSSRLPPPSIHRPVYIQTYPAPADPVLPDPATIDEEGILGWASGSKEDSLTSYYPLA